MSVPPNDKQCFLKRTVIAGRKSGKQWECAITMMWEN